MGNQFRVEVLQSSKELHHRSCHVVTAATKDRVQMVYWIKTTGDWVKLTAPWAIATRQELSQRLRRDQSTISRPKSFLEDLPALYLSKETPTPEILPEPCFQQWVLSIIETVGAQVIPY